MSNVVKCVLWDLDGTLVSTKRLYLEAYRRALAPYLGRALTDEEILGHRSRSEIRFLKSQAAEHYDACLRDFKRFYAELHETHFGGVYPGVPEMLDALRQRGVQLGIVTGKSRSSYEAGVAAADLGPFDVFVFDDDVQEPKPSPEGILLAIEQLAADPMTTLYVGDALSDVEAANAADVPAAAALWSRAGDERAAVASRIRAAGVLAILDRPADILRLV